MEEMCLVDGCAYKHTTGGKSIYYVPKNDERRNAWLKAIDLGTYLPHLFKIVVNNKRKSRYFVCGDHFDFLCFTDNLKLKPDAVPRATTTSAIKEEPSSTEPSKTSSTVTGEVLLDYSGFMKMALGIIMPPFWAKNDLIQLTALCQGALKLKTSDGTVQHSMDLIPVALNTYGNNPSVYSLLQENFHLPMVEDLKNFNMAINPGLDVHVLNMLKLKISKFTDKAKICTLCLDILPLKKNLHYDVEEDRLHGFQEIGDDFQCLAGKFALVVILRGIYDDIKIPVGYIITASLDKYQEINKWVDSVIATLMDIGFDIKAIVSEFKPCFVAALNHRNLNEKNNFITCRDKKIYYIFDVFSLFKSAKNSFMVYDFYYADGKIAKWEHIENLHNVEEGKMVKLVPNLTKNSLEDNHDKFQVFDSKVANALSFYSELQILEESVLETSNFIAKFGYLYNFLTSSDLTKEVDENVSNENKQRENRLSDIIKFLSELKLIQEFSKEHDNFREKLSTENPLKFIRGLLITINSIKNLCQDLKEGEYNLSTRNLNKECFDDFHTNIIREAGKESGITCFEFNRAFRKVFVRTMLQNYQDSNVETNFSDIFSDIYKYIHKYTCKINSTTIAIVESDDKSYRHLLNFHDVCNWTPDKNRERYLITSCYQIHGRCEEFVKYLLQSGSNPVIEVLKTEAEADNVEDKVPDCDVYPPNDFACLVQELLLIHVDFAKKRPMCPQIGVAMLNFYIPRCVPYSPCTCFPYMFLVKLVIRTIIEDIVIMNNEILESDIDKVEICFPKHFMEIIN